jgi:tellurite resistance protein TehA-like permease
LLVCWLAASFPLSGRPTGNLQSSCSANIDVADTKGVLCWANCTFLIVLVCLLTGFLSASPHHHVEFT